MHKGIPVKTHCRASYCFCVQSCSCRVVSCSMGSYILSSTATQRHENPASIHNCFQSTQVTKFRPVDQQPRGQGRGLSNQACERFDHEGCSQNYQQILRTRAHSHETGHRRGSKRHRAGCHQDTGLCKQQAVAGKLENETSHLYC